MRFNPTPVSNGGSTKAGFQSDIVTRKKQQLGGMMQPDEARMNRALLQEIARVKRGD